MDNQFGKKTFRQFGKKPWMTTPPKRSPQQIERMRVIAYLQDVKVEGMRKHLCFSCAASHLYDKNNKLYAITRTATLEEVKKIVEEIRKINADGNS